MIVLVAIGVGVFLVNQKMNEQAMSFQTLAGGNTCKVGETEIPNNQYCAKTAAMHRRGSKLCCKNEHVKNMGYSPNDKGVGKNITKPLTVYVFNDTESYGSGRGPCYKKSISARTINLLLTNPDVQESDKTIIKKSLEKGFVCYEDSGIFSYTSVGEPVFSNIVSNNYCIKCRCGKAGGSVGHSTTSGWYINCN